MSTATETRSRREKKTPTEELILHYVTRVEALQEEQAGLRLDLKEVMAEAKIQGLAPNILRKIVKLRKMDREKIEEEDSLMHLYRQALGL